MEPRPETKSRLTLEQVAAVETLDRHVSVTAGPGAGKTTVLVGRYLHILRENKNLDIDQIVAITFTNRAANEMRERLRKQLDGILLTAAPEERRRWMSYKRTLDGAIITTIHGFCSRLLREFPVEARVDPQFILLDEHQAATLLENAVEETLTEFINSGHEAISRLTAGVGRGQLAAMLVELYRKVRGQGLFSKWLREQADQSHSSWEEYRVAFSQVERLVETLIRARGLPDRAEGKRIELQRSWPRLRPLLLNPQLPLADYCREVVELRDAARPTAGGRISIIVKELDELFWGKTREKPYGQIPSLRFDLVAREYACEVLKVVISIETRLEETKRQLAVLDFDDLQIRALRLLEKDEVLLRASRRYKFFLVDEFQDTNPLQRDLMSRLALQNRHDANLFIVGDPKQSIYGFRGTDVEVFREMTEALVSAGGVDLSLRTNFRSEPEIINFFNLLFARLFEPSEGIAPADLGELGYVRHEASIPGREKEAAGPLVELMVDTLSGDKSEPKAQKPNRERDAQQLTKRINSLVAAGTAFGDIALLFRAMTDAQIYESAFRRANIPYQTVLGRGFYERQEIMDLIQLLRFLDNRTDELALAAVLRSPLVGISDNALLALRLAPRIGETPEGEAPQPRWRPRKLAQALREQNEINFIAPEDREALDRATAFLKPLIEKRNRYPVGDLLRLAVKSSEYMTIIAANFDGAQRIANVEKLFTLAERFERSGAHLIRDFVKYVHDFEAIGSRESEGQLDETSNAVKLMSIHQAKGLEFPIVIIPDLQRIQAPKGNWFSLDRYLGLTLKVPNGRGEQVKGGTFEKFNEREKLREHFESLRLLYVAATRAKNRLILSAATDELSKLDSGRDCWLKWIWQALGFRPRESGIVELAAGVKVQFTINLPSEVSSPLTGSVGSEAGAQATDLEQPSDNLFPLLRSLQPERDRAVHRFSVTQLINYQRCPRQYYFDRLLHVPAADEMAVWNDAEAPEPPANLTATLKGAVIHRFCETYSLGEEVEGRLRHSLDDVVGSRPAEFAERLLDIGTDEALKELLPFARNYLSSDVFKRIERAREAAGTVLTPVPAASPGLWSELNFRLRRPFGILTGTIDKLLVSASPSGKGFDIEIVDFKTNRIRSRPSSQENASTSSLGPHSGGGAAGAAGGLQPSVSAGVQAPLGLGSRPPSSEATTALNATSGMQARRVGSQQSAMQFTLDFSESEPAQKRAITTSDFTASALPSLTDEILRVASDYQLQMQAYALAVRELMPDLVNTGSEIRVTLHFLDPDVESHLTEDLLELNACARAIDQAFLQLISSREPEHFPIRAATHCRMCNFLQICVGGREWIAEQKIAP
ncbi:helicase-exonuclease AddAB subunit AddA [soil metagenome]